jgi:hypothetical protein
MRIHSLVHRGSNSSLQEVSLNNARSDVQIHTVLVECLDGWDDDFKASQCSLDGVLLPGSSTVGKRPL